MSELHLAYAAVGALTVVLVLVSARLRTLPVTEPMLGLALGVLIGPGAAGLLEISEEVRTPLLLEGSRLLLAISLVGVALRFPVSSLRPVLRPVLLLIGVVMPLAAVVTGVLGHLLLGLPVALAALLGACLCPTDPVLSSGVVSGRQAERALPDRTRAVLTEESGANDGLALPLVLLALPFVLGEAVLPELGLAVYQVLAAVAVGAVLGHLTGRGVRASDRNEDVERTPELILTLLMAVAVLGAARLLDSDGVLAVFAAGLAYNAAVGRRERGSQDALDEAFNRYLVVPVFVLLGVTLPYAGWADLGWRAVPFAAGVLVLRRPPVVAVLRRALGLRPLDGAFVGWFGPIGVSALFYLTFSADEGVTDPRLFAAGTLAIVVSTLAHGASAVPLRRAYARRS